MVYNDQQSIDVICYTNQNDNVRRSDLSSKESIHSQWIAAKKLTRTSLLVTVNLLIQIGSHQNVSGADSHGIGEDLSELQVFYEQIHCQYFEESKMFWSYRWNGHNISMVGQLEDRKSLSMLTAA